MNDLSPNAIFLSSAFEPSPEALHAFARSEKERSRPVEDRKQPMPVLPKSKPPAPRRPPPTELIELSSDEEMPDFSEILAGTKKEGGQASYSCAIGTAQEAFRESKGKRSRRCMDVSHVGLPMQYPNVHCHCR